MSEFLLLQPAVPRWVTAISGALSLLGLSGLALTFFLGFETPNTALLAISVALTFATPLALLWHVSATRTLTAAEKRHWMRELTGAGAWSAMSEYMTSLNLRESARRRAEDAAERRAARNRN
jgi:hypothetical protein